MKGRLTTPLPPLRRETPDDGWKIISSELNIYDLLTIFAELISCSYATCSFPSLYELRVHPTLLCSPLLSFSSLFLFSPLLSSPPVKSPSLLYPLLITSTNKRSYNLKIRVTSHMSLINKTSVLITLNSEQRHKMCLTSPLRYIKKETGFFFLSKVVYCMLLFNKHFCTNGCTYTRLR